MSSKGGSLSSLLGQWIQRLLNFFKQFGGLPKLVTRITFDDVPSGTMINTHYQGKGVTFSSVVSLSSNAYAARWVENGLDTNVVTLLDPTQLVPPYDGLAGAFAGDQGAVKALFETPKQKVCIDARGVNAAEILGEHDAYKPFLEAFDAADNLVGKVYYPYKLGDQDWGSWQTLTIDRPSADISYVLFSSVANPPDCSIEYGGIYGVFDNLEFS